MKKNNLVLLTFIVVSLSLCIAAQDIITQLASARAAMDKADYATALADLDKVLKAQPSNETALTMRARIYVRQAKYAEALTDANKVLLKNPQNYEALNVRGVAKRDSLKDLNGAIADFNKALSIFPEYYFAELNKGITFGLQGKNFEALPSLNRARIFDPEARPYVVLTSQMDKAITAEPNKASLYSLRAYAYFRQVVDSKPRPADSKALLAKGKADSEKALQLDANDALGYALRSLHMTDELKHDDALADAQKAISMNPKLFLGYVAKTFAMLNKNDPNGGLEEIEKAFALVPNDMWVAEWRGAVAERANNPRAQQVKAEILAAKKAAAASELETAKKNVDENPWDFGSYDALYYELSSYSVLMGGETWKESRAYWEKLVDQNPNNICAIRFLGEYKGARFYMDMINFLNDGLGRYDGKNGEECAAQIAFRIGREFASRNRYDEANTFFARAKEIKPDLKYLDGNIAANKQQKAASDAEDARFKALSVPVPSQTSSESSASKNSKPKSAPCSAQKISEAISAYNRIHGSVESDARELNSAFEKYKSAAGYRVLYTGTYARIKRIQSRIIVKIGELLKAHGSCLPAEAFNHIVEDRQKMYDSKILAPWEN